MLMPMPSAKATFAIGGKDTQPSQVRARDVALALEKLEIAIIAAARNLDPGIDETEFVVALTAIVHGSDGLVLEVPEPLQAGVSALSTALSNAEYSSLPRQAYSALWELDQRLTPKYGEWGFNENKQIGVMRSRVSSSSRLATPAKPHLLESQTTVYGWLYDAGGKSQPRLAISVDGRSLHVEIDKEMARRAGGRLYTTVGLEGIAYWNPDTLQIEKFRAVRLLDYEEKGLTEALTRVAAGAHKSLVKVDLVKHFEDEGGDDG